MIMDEKTLKQIIVFQRNEITEYFIYRMLGNSAAADQNRKVLNRIAEKEYEHYSTWKKYTQREVKPFLFKKWKYFLISRLFGLTFGIKLMENNERGIQPVYEGLTELIPEVANIVTEENDHEKQLIALIDEERLKYIGSVVLGLNDALVELTGALAGLTLALQNTRLVAIAGLITGIAASLSMAASEYLSTKTENQGKHPFSAAVYTGITYIFTVLFLISPFLIFGNIYVCLSVTIFNAVLVIFLFTYYISVARDLPFFKRFFEMVGISLGVAGLSFIIGFFVRLFLKIDV